MRTTVEIDDRQRAELLELAAQRGDRGIARIVREALDLHLKQQRARRVVSAQTLKLQGSFSDGEADALQAFRPELREQWR